MASEDLFEEEFSEDIKDSVDENDDCTYRVFEKGPCVPADDQHPEHTSEMTNRAAVDKSDKSGQESKLFQLPLARIRNIMKLDPDVTIASNEAVFLVARSTESFIESLAREAYSYTAQAKKKTVQKRDVELAISSVDSLMFLDGTMSF